MSDSKNMIEIKKEQVKARREIVRRACEEALGNGLKITYKEISSICGIPYKTLERSPYRDDIKYYRELDSKEEEHNIEIKTLKDQIKQLRMIIKQLYKENHNLKTMLFENDII